MRYLAKLSVFILLLSLLPSVYAQDEEESVEDNAAAAKKTVYMEIKPAFVLNYGGVGKLRYLKTSITLRVNGDFQSSVRRHMPYIRHTIVMLLSNATVEDMSSMEGTEMLRQNTLAAVRSVLLAEEGEEFVFDLLFNSFIVQK